MKRTVLPFILIVVLAVFSITSSLYSLNFDEPTNVINDYRAGKDVDFKVVVYPDSFLFYHTVTTEIPKSEFDKVLSEIEQKGLPDRKLMQNGERNSYQIDSLLTVSQVEIAGDSEKFEKTELVVLGTFSNDTWPQFLRILIDNGLVEYEILRFEGIEYYTLGFQSICPQSINFGSKTLSFSLDAQNYLRISPTTKTSNSGDKFVILVHEPHWSVYGQYQLVPGLNQLITENSEHSFRFLVEGAFTEETKEIDIEPLMSAFAKDTPKEAMAYSLLSNFMIDGPMAYRAIYDPDLPAIAIDDMDLINQTPAEVDLMAGYEVSQRLIEMSQMRGRFTETQAQRFSQALLELFSYSRADISDLHGQHLIDYYNELSNLYDELADALVAMRSTFQSSDVQGHINFLREQADAARSNGQRFEFALGRDKTMVQNILAHFSSSHSESIPIAFIGNFHTDGMTKLLREQNIGYIVLEPRFLVVPSEKEKNNFNKALHPSTRSSYLESISTLKLPVSPTLSEIARYYKKYLSKIATVIKNLRKKLLSILASSSNHKIDVEAFTDAIDNNGDLCCAEIEFGGGNNQPPTNFKNAFAYFEPGEAGSKLFIYNENGQEWQNRSVYKFLKSHIFIPINENFRNESSKARFWSNPENGDLFLNFFDPQTNRYYLYQNPTSLDALPNVIRVPQNADKSGIELRQRLSEMNKHEEKSNG